MAQSSHHFASPALWRLFAFSLLISLAILPATAQQPQPPILQASLSGIVTNPDGAEYEGVHLDLSRPDSSTAPISATTDANGHFAFPALAPGPWQLTVASDGFTTRQLTGTLLPGQDSRLPPIVLGLAGNTTEVLVSAATRLEVAQQELHEEEQQHVLGFIPNFYVVYDRNAPPLTARQKFHLAWRSEIDPVNIVSIAATAGIEQAQGEVKNWGNGVPGYSRRLAAAAADDFIGNMLGGAVFPALFRQDPRYVWRGTGSKRSRVLYAIANAFICKGDNGHWQFDYSSIAGDLAGAGISDLYYPAKDRDGISLTVENMAIGKAASAVGNIFQEFVVRKFTPRLHAPNP